MSLLCSLTGGALYNFFLLNDSGFEYILKIEFSNISIKFSLRHNATYK